MRQLIEEICPNRKNHTPDPDDYMAWHEWAENKMKTHKQIKCSGCGLWAIWIPKRRRSAQANGEG